LVYVWNHVEVDELTQNETLEIICNQAASLLFDQFSQCVTFGISSYHHLDKELKQGYEEALTALTQHFFHGNESVFFHKPLEEIRETVKIPEIRGPLFEMIRSGKIDEINTLLDSLFEQWKETLNELHIKKAGTEMIVNALSACPIIDREEYDLIDEPLIYKKLWSYPTFERVTDAIRQILCEIAQSIVKRGHSHIIHRVMSYLNIYYKKDISLNSLAEHIHMNQWYLSKIIKNETGITFSDILRQIRIDQAKKLLENGSLKTCEVSERVGYVDVRYFSQVFKKHVGLTPSEYRQLIKE
jgi:two-component system response regulator YesN